MLPGILGMMVGTGEAPNVTQTDSRTTAANSFASVSFGADVPGRQIILLVWHNNTATNPGVTPTATIGGVAATRVEAQSTGNGSGNAVGTSIFIAAPTGTSGTVNVTWGSVTVTIVALRVIGYSGTKTASAGNDSGGNSVNLSVPANGLVVGMAGNNSTGIDVAWTNLTEKANGDAAGSTRSWGWDFPLASQTRTISYTPFAGVGVQGRNTFAVASFPPL